MSENTNIALVVPPGSSTPGRLGGDGRLDNRSADRLGHSSRWRAHPAPGVRLSEPK
ncbi:hypothetical protein ACFWAY_47110 [Rhodococcus sp. NPDC059968]|uniref:hypothetical protein n=1 Tax=Rhodococcus sp. NPDC059968 TaxID=3347017 RepID=UPI00366AA930